MSQASAVQADIDIKGNVSGQIAVGRNILQLGNMSGGIVNVALSSTQASFKRRGGAVNLRPRREKSFLDRQSEIKAIKNALKSSKSLLVVGAGGIGKTALLHQAANLPETRKFRDGAVFLEGSDRGLDDVLQFIFQIFYQSRANVMPTEAQIRQNLCKINALILLDDLRLTREEVTVLLDVLPRSTFVLTSRERTLWGDQEIILLGGLPDDDAVKLFARELKRSLKAKERDIIRKTCVKLGGHPLRILQAATVYREKGKPLTDIQSWLQQKIPDKEFLQSLLDALDESEKRILAAVGAVGRAVIPFEHLEPLLKDKNVKKRLKRLISLRLVQAHSPRYSLTDTVAESLTGILDLSSWEDTLIDYFVNWLEGQPAPTQIEESAEALIYTVKKAGEKERWPEVIRLGRALEHGLILWKRWQAWADILNLILEAAKALGDRKVEAWALHQLGSRAMCLGITDQARELLTQALNIRRAIDDQDGLAVTQHNLDTLLNPPMPQVAKTGGLLRWLGRGFMGLVILTAVAALATAIALAIGGVKLPFPIPPTIAPIPRSTSTRAPSPSPIPNKIFTPTDTSAPIGTFTPTPMETLSPTPTGTLTIPVTQMTTPTFTPTTRASTRTRTFTTTPTRTPTQTPIPTGSGTPTPTKTSTHTPTPTRTFTPTPSPTSTVTFTPTYSPSPTLTPTFTPTPDTTGPDIKNLNASPQTVGDGTRYGCDVTFTADIRDPAGVDSALVVWTNSLGASDKVKMVPGTPTWSVTFRVNVPSSGALNWSVVAYDTFLNESILDSGIKISADPKNGCY